VDVEPEQVEVERAELEVQDLARLRIRRRCDRQRRVCFTREVTW